MPFNGTTSRAAGLMLASRRAALSDLHLQYSTAALLRYRHYLCIAYSLGAWSNNCDSDAGHHGRRQQHTCRHRIMKSTHRNLSRTNKLSHDYVQTAMKSALAHIAHDPTVTSASKYINIKDIKSWSDELSGVRPGWNIEDAEREAIDHLLSFGKKNGLPQYTHRPSLGNLRKYLRGKRTKNDTPKDVLHANTTSQNMSFANFSSSRKFKSNTSELNKYEPKKFDNPNATRPLTSEEASKNYNDLDRYKPAEWNEPDGLPRLTREEESKQYKDLNKYASPDFANDVAALESSKSSSDDLQKYRPVEWNEPDGLPGKTPEELSKDYDDLEKYGPVTWNEPDGLRKLTPEELSKKYDDVDNYGPVKWNEPDGLPMLTPEEKSRQYDDLDRYSKPFVASDVILRAHEAAQQDTTPKAEPIAAKIDVPAADPIESYQDLDKYGPVQWNEPDGLRKLTPEELSKNYEDLHLYTQYPNSGPETPRIHPEEASKKYADLQKYRSFPNIGSAEERIHPELVSKQYKDLCKYPLFVHEEPDQIQHDYSEEQYQDLHKYQPQTFDAPEMPYPMHPEQASKVYKDLDSYIPVMHNEPDGKPIEKVDPVAKSLEAWESSCESEMEPRAAAEIRNDVLRRAYRNSKQTMVQRAEVQQTQEQGAAAKGAQDASSKQALTGTLSKDFPEELETYCNTSRSSSNSTLLPTHPAEDSYSSNSAKPPGDLGYEKEEVDFSSMDESFPKEKISESSRLQSAVDRDAGLKPLLSTMSRLERMQLEEDPYTKCPQGLEISYMDECAGRPTWPTFIRHRKGKVEGKGSGLRSSTGSSAEQQPILYKMLAYDPSTQSISVAETSLGVHGTPSPATPAEVLLRVSNPSKFFPYFSAMQEEGYEIASGGGDVLVFRKVQSETAFKGGCKSTINPIDMMGRSAASNFASPTGYVNFESPQYRPVNDGQNREAKLGKKKRSLGRKLVIGTAWVAGTAYAVSTAGEYLSTGGRSF